MRADLTIAVPELDVTVGARWDDDEAAEAVFVFAHGAGAGMHHAFMGALTERLVARGIAVLRYEFPYVAAGRKRPDRAPALEATVRAAVAEGVRRAGDRPVVAGGKSMGGRMTVRADADAPLPGVCGLVFVGFPLHPAGKPSVTRAEHLGLSAQPLLFLQGTRDALADLALLRPIVGDLGARATLHIVEGADHGFHVLKRIGRTDDDVLDELAQTMSNWIRTIMVRCR